MVADGIDLLVLHNPVNSGMPLIRSYNTFQAHIPLPTTGARQRTGGDAGANARMCRWSTISLSPNGVTVFDSGLDQFEVGGAFPATWSPVQGGDLGLVPGWA
ncbi:MAG: hypothetical protein Ct9H300mP12_07440 [Acidimicrobiales bacterium]|nr:MAG: hypothetical protein Ct9H300mP12_07440 [Acidimicrobiales bacterium]